MYFFVFLIILSGNVHTNEIKGFDDTVLFNINWPGDISIDPNYESESLIVSSVHQEKFKCLLPTLSERELKSDEKYNGPTALELISPLFSQTTCSFRLESYWTYEVCHGRYIRQYHEDREGKTVKVQEYILGKWDDKYLEKLLMNSKIGNEKHIIPTKKIDNINLPYYEIIMENGTLCDLNNHKRITKVLYVCYLQGKHEIYSLKETSTCVYEVIILSHLLCAHPKYRPKETGEHKIDCISVHGNYKKPYSLVKLAHDSAMLRRKSDLDRFHVELIKVDKSESIPVTDPKLVDTTPIKNFLLGKDCLNGGSGWWKFEFCYGKSVEQYHVEKGGKKMSINLGIFNKAAHLEWIRNNPNKKPKPLEQRKQLSHFYSGGTVCDKTGKPRQTEVKLKCLKNPSSPSSVSLYLLEPKYCHYILGVESPLICEILSKADEYGLVEINDNVQETESKSHEVNIKL